MDNIYCNDCKTKIKIWAINKFDKNIKLCTECETKIIKSIVDDIIKFKTEN